MKTINTYINERLKLNKQSKIIVTNHPFKELYALHLDKKDLHAKPEKEWKDYINVAMSEYEHISYSNHYILKIDDLKDFVKENKIKDYKRLFKILFEIASTYYSDTVDYIELLYCDTTKVNPAFREFAYKHKNKRSMSKWDVNCIQGWISTQDKIASIFTQ